MADKHNEIIRTGSNGRRSTCVAHGGLVWLSGITSVVLEGTMQEQAQDIFAQIEKLLAVNGTDKNRILSANVCLRSMDEYGDFNAVWDEWVVDGFEPARSVTAAELALPEYRVKVSVVAAQ